jgi:hypothetical protein
MHCANEAQHRHLELLMLGPGSQRDSGWDSVTAVSSQMTPCISAHWTVRLGEAGSTTAVGSEIPATV